MTVSSTTNRVSYAGNGATTSFSFPYIFTAQADLVVLSVVDATGVSTTQTLDTDYTISGTADASGRYTSGANVVMTTAPASGRTLVIYRDPARTQALDLVENDPLPAEEVEKAFDKLTLMVQRVRDLLSRAFTLPDSDTSGASTELPTPAASKLIGWNSGATGLTNYAAASIADTIVPTTFMETLLDDATAEEARTTLGAFAAAGGNLSGLAAFCEGAAVASASSCNIWATDGNTRHITGTTTINDFATAPQAGALMFLIFDGAVQLTQSANLNVNGGGSNVTTAAGDMAIVYADTTTQMDVFVIRKSGREVVPPTPVLSASYDSGDLTIALGGAHTLTHSLGAVPKVFNLLAKCTAVGGDAGYAQDEVIVLATNGADAAGSNYGVGMKINSTQIILRVGSGSGNNFANYPHATTGAINGLDYTKWALIVRAYA